MLLNRLCRNICFLAAMAAAFLAAPVTAQNSDGEWKFVDINREFCIINSSQGTVGVSVWMKRKGSNGKVELRAAGGVPEIKHQAYLGDVKFDHGISMNAEVAGVTKDLFNVTVYVWSISDTSFLNSMKARNSVLLRMDSETVANVSLRGSAKAVDQLLECSDWSPSESRSDKFYIGDDTVSRLEEVLWKDSRNWVLNRYVPNSVFRTEGREMLNPRNFTFRAWYKYNRTRTGFVDVEVVNSKINCIRYHDAPFECKRIY